MCQTCQLLRASFPLSFHHLFLLSLWWLFFLSVSLSHRLHLLKSLAIEDGPIEKDRRNERERGEERVDTAKEDDRDSLIGAALIMRTHPIDLERKGEMRRRKIERYLILDVFLYLFLPSAPSGLSCASFFSLPFVFCQREREREREDRREREKERREMRRGIQCQRGDRDQWRA
jgi:hypothetical protein